MVIKKHFLIFACSIFIVSLASGTLYGQNKSGDEYDRIGYNEKATENPVARLETRLKNGEVQLEFNGHRGYLDSFLKALDIDPASQLLVFSKTSLQYELISAEAPRALYFSENTYIGWVQNSNIIEIVTVDTRLGIVFYVFNNTEGSVSPIERKGQSCLVCHDSNGTMGGGVPLLMTLSSIYRVDGKKLLDATGEYFITDQTPLRDRWGGWYVSGLHGTEKHLGNFELKSTGTLEQLDDARIGNIETLTELATFDTSPYPTATSDIVALMIMEHQINVQNQISYIKFKAPALLERIGYFDLDSTRSWHSLPEKAQRALTRSLDKLVQVLLLVGAVEFEDSISGASAFTDWFASTGIKDKAGQSLWDLNLDNRLFKYSLSFLIYSENFDTLPFYAKEYVYQKLAGILENRDASETYAYLSIEERGRIFEILKDTKKEFVNYIENEL